MISSKLWSHEDVSFDLIYNLFSLDTHLISCFWNMNQTLKFIILVLLYSLASNQCVTILNCDQCDSSGILCSRCSSGYLPNSDASQCILCNITNCLACTTSNICDSCATSYSLFTDKSLCVSCNTANCSYCMLPDSCSKCLNSSNSPYFGVCYTCNITNCVSCGPNGTCAKCIANYKPNILGTGCFQCTITQCSNCNQSNVC